MLTQVMREVDRVDILFLGLILHDIGKGQGGGHSERGARMVPDIAGRLHLNTDETGDEVIRASGYATIPKSQRPAHKEPAYLRKYRSHILGLGMTVEDFAEQYRYPIRVRRLRFH